MSAWTSGWSMAHLVVAPVLVPLAAAGVLAAIGAQHRRVKAAIGLLSCVLMLATAVALLLWVDGQDRPGAFGVYLPGNWPVPFGIVLVADRLSAMMLVLVAATGLASLLYSLARWHRAGVHFQVLLQLQLMGLNGAFLTADLFNLFVFFEVLLAASYGLLLHGGGEARVRSGLHYIAINLVASLLFLIGVSLLYGVTGTLNMADIAAKLPAVPASDRGLLHAGAALLAIAFLAKAAIWPMNFWLPAAYRAASTPVAGLFAILTKVGVYAILRLWTLCFPATAGGSALFGSEALVWGGLATLAFGTVGMLASHNLARVVAFSIIGSSGTLVAAAGFDHPALTAGALFYLASVALAR
jgi:multicomponent K+:H+ antiporter subunit D